VSGPQAFGEVNPQEARRTYKEAPKRPAVSDQAWVKELRGSSEKEEGMAQLRKERHSHFADTFVHDSVLGQTGHFAECELDEALLSLFRCHLSPGKAYLLLGYQRLAFDLSHQLHVGSQ
jgi:hypothetical protein